MAKASHLLIVLLLACSLAANAQKDKLERLMDYYAAHDHFNGTVLVVRKGAVLLSKGYGYRDAENKIKNTENTIYPIGSNTRQITAEVILQLDSKGMLGLEDRLNKYLPDYPNGDRITLRNLLTHSSGIYNYTKDPIFSGPYSEKPMNKADVLARFQHQPLAFAPGSDFAFSNSDYFLLGMVIEKITKKKYERVVKEDILLTCNMGHSGFGYQHLRDANKAVGYTLSEDGQYTPASITDSSITYASAGMYSSAADLLLFHRALLHHRLLPKDWQDLAFTPHKNQYALGWNITHSYYKLFMEHGGTTSGFNCYVVRQENDDLFIALLENVTRPGETQAMMATNIVQSLYEKNYILPADRKVVYGPPVAESHVAAEKKPITETKAKTKTNALLKKYVGTFEINPAFTITFTVDGDELFATTPEKKAIKMIRQKDNFYRTEGINAEIEFVKSKNGAVNKIVLHQQDQLIPGVRAD